MPPFFIQSKKKKYISYEEILLKFRKKFCSITKTINDNSFVVDGFVCLFGNKIFAQTTVSFTSPGTTTWVCPAGVTSVVVECWGAGGAGGMNNADYSNGGGGGGGAYKKTINVTVVPGTTYTITVGAGGIITANSGNGGTTSVVLGTTTVAANGGKGGTDAQPGQGGAGGTGGTFNGGAGADALNFTYGGGGGGSGGTTANGSTATNATGATAVTGGGAGGNGPGIPGGDGAPGIAPGGGGGGGRSPSTGDFHTGGNGANGQVIITYSLSTYTLSGVTICAGEASQELVNTTACAMGAAQSITKYPTASATGSTNSWSTINRIYTDNGSYATRSLNNNTSAIISTTGYDFSSIPDDAVINGIQVTIGKIASSTSSIKDNAINLIVDGVVSGTNSLADTAFWGTTEVAKTYGSATNLWGYTSLTVAQIKENSFGVAFSAKETSKNTKTASIDYISISVTYSVPGTTNWYTVASGGTIVQSGSAFNPVNDAQVIAQGPSYASLTDTNTPGTYTFYAECSSKPGYRTPTTFVVNAKPPTPTIAITQPTCSLRTAAINFTNSAPASGLTYTVTGTIPAVTAVNNTTGVFSGLAAGFYTYSVTNTSGCSSSASVEIKAFVELENIWDGTAWSKPGVPTAEQKLVFDGDYSENINIVGCSCQVNASTDVTITSGHTMTITNEVSVDVDGFLTFEDEASLVQINNATNTGEIDYIRTTDTGIYNTDYIYWSSPVEEFSLGGVSQHRTLTDKYYSYEPTATGEDWQQESTFTKMIPGKGYIIRGPEYGPSVQPGDKYTVTFSGVPNNGHYEINELFADKSYLIGNPYPSALDADTFLANNVGVLNGTLYFWTHNTDMQNRNLILSTAGSGAYAYTSNDYATYNATGGVGVDSGTVTAPAPIGSNPRGDNNANPPSGKIASGQSFFASTKTGLTNSKIIFDNSMRVGFSGITGNNTQFFKTKNPNGKTANTKVIEKNRVWLNMSNAEGAFKQTLVGYLTDATNDYDDRFDGESFDGNEYVDFYSVNQDLNLTIQGRALPFDENDEVPLGFRTTINGDFTINIAQVDGLLTNQAVFLEDKLTNTVFDLKSGNYTFNTVEGTFNDRFVLKYTNSKTLNIDATDKEDGVLAFYSNNYKTLIIKNNLADTTVNSVALFNMLGQRIEKWDISDSEQTNVQIPIKNISTGIYIVKVKTTIGESSKKIIVNQ